MSLDLPKSEGAEACAQGRARREALGRLCRSPSGDLPHVVSFWQDGQLVVVNYATGVLARGTAFGVQVLDDLTEWRSWTELKANRSPEEQRLLRRLVDLLVKRTFLTRSTDKPRRIEGALTRWGTWNPAAGFFHRATRDVDFGSTPRDQIAASCAKAVVDPLPASLKPERPGAVQLPPANVAGDLAVNAARSADLAVFRQRLDRGRSTRDAVAADVGCPWLDSSARRWQIRAQDVTFWRSATQHRSLCSRAQGRWTSARALSLPP